jgi:hypothetical protein
LVGIVKTDELFCGDPPAAVCLRMFGFRVVFVVQGTVRSKPFGSRRRHGDRLLFHAGDQFFIVQYLRSFEKQPGCFDVMPVRNDMIFRIPFFIEKQLHGFSFRVYDVRDNRIEHSGSLFFELFASGHTLYKLV